MDIVKTKEKIKDLIDENEVLLNEVRRILEFSSTPTFELTDEQKAELDEMKKMKEEGKLKFKSWDEVKENLLNRLNK